MKDLSATDREPECALTGATIPGTTTAAAARKMPTPVGMIQSGTAPLPTRPPRCQGFRASIAASLIGQPNFCVAGTDETMIAAQSPVSLAAEVIGLQGGLWMKPRHDQARFIVHAKISPARGVGSSDSP